MCGIYAYQGTATNAHQILLHGLEKLEYRGYDSAGLFVTHADSSAILVREVGKVSSLSNKVSHVIDDAAILTAGIAHTRWATHGGVEKRNSHPHQDKNAFFTVVHNGIIENYLKLKKELIADGYVFSSDTDTEVVANLLHSLRDGNFLSTVEKTLTRLHGAYALVIMCKDAPDEMIGVKLGSPLVFGRDNNDCYFSSDTQALAGIVKNIVFLDDGELIHVKKGRYTMKQEGKEIFKNLEILDEASLKVSKGSYEHWMLKEIEEQPNVLRRVMKGRIDMSDYSLVSEAFHGMQKENYEQIVFVACGTSYHAGLMAACWIEQLAGIPCRVEIASEAEYKPLFVKDTTLYVFISQSGETADSLAVLKLLKEQGAKTFGVVNVVGSSISRLTDHGLFTRAGSEIGVASTKAFLAQIGCLFLFSLFLAKKRGLTKGKYVQLLEEFVALPAKIESIISQKKQLKDVAEELSVYSSVLFLGRGFQVPIAHEGALKLKEVSYQHAESYPCGELKHGPLALIQQHMPTVFLYPEDQLFHQNTSSMNEIKAREGKILVVGGESELADWHTPLPKTLDELYPFVTVVVTQLLAYYAGCKLGTNVDKPRNLAKSVTVK